MSDRISDRPIPQTDPKAAYLAQQGEIDAVISRVLQSGRYILGPEVAAFEAAFSAYLGCAFAIGVASGTDALVLALRALGVGSDDYVVAPAHGAVATVAAIELAGAKPLLVDIDPIGYGLDPQALKAALEQPPGRIAALIAVHLYGQCCDLDVITGLARRHHVRVVEDCAQCHGATIGKRRAGTIGDISAFSFYPTKNLGALGDGGAVATQDEALAARVRALREYGWRTRQVSDAAGLNSRLDELQAAILTVKLATLDAGNARRQAIASAYDEGLQGLGLGLPARHDGASHVYHQYVVRSARRDRLRAVLQSLGAETNIHYPVAIHLQPAYRGRSAIGAGGLTESERAASEVLSLPIYPQLEDAEVSRVIAAIIQAVREIDRSP